MLRYNFAIEKVVKRNRKKVFAINFQREKKQQLIKRAIKKKSKERILKIEAKKIKSDNFTGSNRENSKYCYCNIGKNA